ncbi:MAG: hypothetical protein M5U34_22920 [Chloroflexi bacterium]|nr:hypothetical protein [Chloroflexota bacterium]
MPEAYDQLEPIVELNEDTELGSLSFSTEVTDRYESINPSTLFAEGFFTIYATFDYKSMADGMEWAWVWRRDGQVIEGGNKLWDGARMSWLYLPGTRRWLSKMAFIRWMFGSMENF